MKILELNEELFAAAQNRFSTRNYSAPPENISELAEIAKSMSDDNVRIEVLRGGVFKGLMGSKIKNTDVFAALVHSKATPAEFAGYTGEAFVLKLTSMGLATCWLGGTMKKALARSLANVSNDEVMECIISIGQPGESKPQRSRNPLAMLCSPQNIDISSLPKWQQTALECARIAPSAVNKQPWRFIVGEGITVEQTSGNFGFGALDCGIAMMHLQLGAFIGGIKGEFVKTEKGYAFNAVSQA